MAQRTPAADGAPDPADGPSARPPADLDERLRTWMGVDETVGAADLDRLHRELNRYLDQAPSPLHEWARRQSRTADAAHAVLTGQAAGDQADGLRDLADLDEDVEARPTVYGRTAQRNAAKEKGRTPITALALVVIVLGVIFGVYQLGDRSGAEQPAQETSLANAASGMPEGMGMGPTPVPVDPAKVDTLSQRVQANPKDVDAMRDLSNMYVQAADYANAATWQARVLEVTPKDTDARLALGASKFNQGDTASAEKEWREVLRIDPKSAEAHYDLGFLYLSKNPPDAKSAAAEWTKVSELAPDSQIAKTAQAHLARIQQMSTASPSAPAAPAPSSGSTGAAE
ncbi:tetratricopeptide repeat protein [Piscicoccus intestinalis]|uniref:tetratricopeptide repeat protein n=1 Tax=Piscicoccus intestinalis TaxID=746033 RepID=UPI0008393EAF|nr:tetratricopeptide repeat protein [Piscicoccus intestinalis]